MEYICDLVTKSEQSYRMCGLMDTNEIVNALKAERERLSHAIEVLEGGSRGSRGRGRPAAPSDARRGPRRMSAEARARIAAAQRKRWAKVKAAKKK